MLQLSFREKGDGGRTLDTVPTFISPLGVQEIRAIEGHDSSALDVVFQSENVSVDGVAMSRPATVTTKVVFDKKATVYSLVPGGWLPPLFVTSARFLVDRNVVILLRRLRDGTGSISAAGLQWWTQFFDRGAATFNPLLYAFEAGYCRKPTRAEFEDAFDEGVSELHEAFPKCQVVQFGAIHYRAAYAQLEAFDERNERETRFLQTICPLVVQRLPRRREADVAQSILDTADKLHLKRASFAVLATLSCLYEDNHGKIPAIGRRVLKPKEVYSEADAFNALSDLRHIELAASGHACFRDEAFSLCTCDKPMALLWSALGPRGECSPDGRITISFDLTNELFARLRDDELDDLKRVLRE